MRCGWLTLTRSETGSPPTRWVGESGVTQLRVLRLDRPQLVEQLVVLGVARSPGRRGRSTGGEWYSSSSPQLGGRAAARIARLTVRRAGSEQPLQVVRDKRLDAGVVGEVEVQRRDRDLPGRDRRDVGAQLVGAWRSPRRRRGRGAGPGPPSSTSASSSR